MVLAPDVLYDPSTAQFQEDIWDVYRTLRDHHPVYRDEARQQYVVTRFEDVWRAVHDWETFSSVVDEAQNLLPQMIYMDPPRHTALRALVSRAFTPKRVAEVESLTRSAARGLLDEIADRGDECELQHEYAAVIPSVVIARMIGVPDEHVADFRTWTESFLEIQGPEDFADAAGKIYALFADLLAARRAGPRDDMMTALIDAEVDGQRLTDEELLGFCLLLILAGNDTTSSLVGSGTVLLAQHPDQRALLLDDPSLWSTAIEEMNRIESPTQVLPRTTTRDVEIRGVTIPCRFTRHARVGRGEPRRPRVPRTGALRRHAARVTPPWFRPRHPLLPRRQPRASRGARRVRGVARPVPELRARGRTAPHRVDLGPGLQPHSAPLLTFWLAFPPSEGRKGELERWGADRPTWRDVLHLRGNRRRRGERTMAQGATPPTDSPKVPGKEPIFRHLDDPDVSWQKVRAQRNADGTEAFVHEKWLAFSPEPQYLSLYAKYDPGMIVRRHGHFSPHIVFILEGDATFGDTHCPTGTHIELPFGAAFGPVVAGPNGCTMFEVMLGDPRSWGDEPEAFEKALANNGAEVLPDPPLDYPEWLEDLRTHWAGAE
jgi:hypothetical protein